MSLKRISRGNISSYSNENVVKSIYLVLFVAILYLILLTLYVINFILFELESVDKKWVLSFFLLEIGVTFSYMFIGTAILMKNNYNGDWSVLSITILLILIISLLLQNHISIIFIAFLYIAIVTMLSVLLVGVIKRYLSNGEPLRLERVSWSLLFIKVLSIMIYFVTFTDFSTYNSAQILIIATTFILHICTLFGIITVNILQERPLRGKQKD